MKHFVNERGSIVTEALDLAVMLGEGNVARLDGYPSIKVLVRTDWDKTRVALVSGGGAGHEPAHAGFVGEGMLTAAVCGEIFASPSVDAVFAAILAVTGEAGCLLIVKNYTGDRLNFGLAAERARALGLDVEMVIVADDIALPDAPSPRGLAGTLFVHKIAGHVARSGASLREVKEAALRAATSARSLGISLSSCTLPGQPTEARLGPEEVELGLGIHGEPGVEKVPYRPVAELVRTMAERLEHAFDSVSERRPLALLVSDLGGVPPIELAVAVRSLILAMKHEIALVFGPDRLMTSLDMKGISISALPLDDASTRALLSEVVPRAWPRGRGISAVAPLPLSPRAHATAYRPSANAGRRRIVETACRALLTSAAELNALDAKVGDGDTGSTFATGANAVLAQLDALPFDDARALCAAIAARLSNAMGGSSGILLSIGIAAMGASLGEPPDFPKALGEGVRRIQEYGGASVGDRTMLDALVPAIAALASGEGLAGAGHAARHGAELTATMTNARAGRSSYLSSASLVGVADPGASAVAAIFEALASM